MNMHYFKNEKLLFLNCLEILFPFLKYNFDKHVNRRLRSIKILYQYVYLYSCDPKLNMNRILTKKLRKEENKLAFESSDIHAQRPLF